MEEHISGDRIQQTPPHNHNLENDDIQFVTERNPLMNAVIMDNIIRYLKYDDIWRFRLVCRSWKKATENVIWKLSRIKIELQPEGRFNVDLNNTTGSFEKEESKLIENFNSTFPSPGFPSNTIVFETLLSLKLFDYFWKERGATTLTNIYFRRFFVPCIPLIDLNHYVTPNLTTLDMRRGVGGQMKISFAMLENIQNLYLDNCEILLNGKIAPKELALFDENTISYNGVVFNCLHSYHQQLLINDFVDFSKIKKLCLAGIIWRLDVGGGAPDLESLELHPVKLEGLNKSQWTTNSLYLNENIYIGVKMKLQSFSLIDSNTIDIQLLPNCLEKLSTKCRYPLVGPQIFVYPKLKYLYLTKYTEDDFPILDFTSCTSLTDFRLNGVYGVNKVDFNKILLPSSINRVKLLDVDITTDASCQLNTVILEECSFSVAKKFLKHVNSLKLVIDSGNRYIADEEEISILNLWRNSNIQELAFAAINWEGEDSSEVVNNDEVLKNVDKAGSHFLFTKENNGKGISIDSSHFGSLSTLSPHEEDMEAMRHGFHYLCL